MRVSLLHVAGNVIVVGTFAGTLVSAGDTDIVIAKLWPQ
jgi:hypothetical protein